MHTRQGTELTILFFSWVLKDVALSRWAGAGALDWDQPVGLWLGELPASGTQREKDRSDWRCKQLAVSKSFYYTLQQEFYEEDYTACQIGKLGWWDLRIEESSLDIWQTLENFMLNIEQFRKQP